MHILLVYTGACLPSGFASPSATRFIVQINTMDSIKRRVEELLVASPQLASKPLLQLNQVRRDQPSAPSALLALVPHVMYPTSRSRAPDHPTEVVVPTPSVSCCTQEAVAAAKAGDHLTSAALLTALLERARRQHLAHKELYACCSNRAAALLQLGLHQPALEDAERAMALLRQSFPGGWVSYTTVLP